MSAPRDLDRQIQSFLAEGPMELPDASYDEVRDRMEQKRQRAFIGPWRSTDMNRYLKIGLAAAAVVVIAVIGFQYLGGPNVGEPSPTATPQPTATLAPTPEPTLSERAELPVGSHHVLWDTPGDIQISVTIPASGWFGGVGRGFIIKDNKTGPPDGAGVLVWQGPLYVYGDRCHWATTLPDTPATTGLEIVEALIPYQTNSTTALSVSLGGYPGALLKLHVPENAVFADCDRGEFRSWVGDPVADDARYHQGPGQDDYAWVIDVNGTPVVIDVGTFNETSTATADEIDAIVHSVVFELP